MTQRYIVQVISQLRTQVGSIPGLPVSAQPSSSLPDEGAGHADSVYLAARHDVFNCHHTVCSYGRLFFLKENALMIAHFMP